jgi:hypothetical protein
MNPSEFVFDRYRYDAAENSLSLHYSFAGGPAFEERLDFDFPPQPLGVAPAAAVDRIFRLIFLFSGVSYYKAFAPPTLRCAAFPLDRATSELVERFYRLGLAEFAFRNGITLDERCRIAAVSAPPPSPLTLKLPRQTCVPVGGGKDSVVSIECLRRAGEPTILFALGEAAPIRATIAAAGLPAIRVRRRLDDALFRLNEAGALNGHVPITGILSTIALAAAVLHGFDAVAMSNEHSASAPNLAIGDWEINHQYSKSYAFERDLAQYVGNHISPSIAYFSLLRPFSEIEIARRFARYPLYFPIFRSCNTVFRQTAGERATGWCGDCPKCRFVFLALAPFVDKPTLIGIFGRDLLDDPTQSAGFAALCGLGQYKPFECVGEVAESTAVIAHLAAHPDWQDDAVLRALPAAFPALGQADPADYRAVFARRGPHRVPPRYLAMLDACG